MLWLQVHALLKLVVRQSFQLQLFLLLLALCLLGDASGQFETSLHTGQVVAGNEGFIVGVRLLPHHHFYSLD